MSRTNALIVSMHTVWVLQLYSRRSQNNRRSELIQEAPRRSDAPGLCTNSSIAPDRRGGEYSVRDLLKMLLYHRAPFSSEIKGPQAAPFFRALFRGARIMAATPLFERGCLPP
jgi:hypothetical protein